MQTSLILRGASDGVKRALSFTDLRRHMSHSGAHVAALVALLLFSPFDWWNLQHNLAHLHHAAATGSDRGDRKNKLHNVASFCKPQLVCRLW